MQRNELIHKTRGAAIETIAANPNRRLTCFLALMATALGSAVVNSRSLQHSSDSATIPLTAGPGIRHPAGVTGASEPHYSAEITTIASFGGQNMNSRVAIEGEHVGACP